MSKKVSKKEKMIEEEYEKLANLLDYDDIPDIIDKLRRKRSVISGEKSFRGTITPVVALSLKILSKIPEANCIVLKRYETVKEDIIPVLEDLTEICETGYATDTPANCFIKDHPEVSEEWECLQKVYEDIMMEDDIRELKRWHSEDGEENCRIFYLEDEEDGNSGIFNGEGTCYFDFD